jgi:hypothetical protein
MAFGAIDSALSTIAACSGVGAFIDFWIKKRGQERVRDWLETWWLRFSYVRWGNLGREEAIFAVQVIDYAFGRKFFSARRMIVAGVITLTFTSLLLALGGSSSLNWSSFRPFEFVVSVAMQWLSVSASLSCTRFAAMVVVRIVTRIPLLNLVGLILIIISQLIIIFFYPIVTSVLHRTVVFLLSNPVAFLSMVKEHPAGVLSMDLDSIGPLFDMDSTDISFVFMMLSFLMTLLINASRLVVTVVFLGSFLLKPVQQLLMGLWARVVESDKPIFTLLFGGGAAAATAVRWVIHTL